jgi:AbiV family abortive infection protein
VPQADTIVIPEERLVEGYEYTVENAIRLLSAAATLQEIFPDKALALAQLGQEEIGKSLTILAAFHLPALPDAWTWFWNGWRSHTLKAHRAYLYEIIHPLRIEMKAPDGTKYAGLPLRKPISKEKESALYVDFDVASNRFLDPANEVSLFDAAARISTLMYLSATADAVRRALLHVDVPFRMREFGAVAFKICSEMVYQQDMPQTLDQFAAISLRHAEIVNDLKIALGSVNSMFEQATGKPVVKEPDGT